MKSAGFLCGPKISLPAFGMENPSPGMRAVGGGGGKGVDEDHLPSYMGMIIHWGDPHMNNIMWVQICFLIQNPSHVAHRAEENSTYPLLDLHKLDLHLTSAVASGCEPNQVPHPGKPGKNRRTLARLKLHAARCVPRDFSALKGPIRECPALKDQSVCW